MEYTPFSTGRCGRLAALTVFVSVFFLLLAPGSYVAQASGRSGPYISVQPQDQTVSTGDSASFSVTALSAGTLSYQWYLVGTDGRDRMLGTAATYNTGAVTTENSGQQYYVIVTDESGSVQSDTATLTVTAGLSITRQPADASVVSGASATFSVEAAGDPPYTYQWYVDMNTGRWQATGSSDASYSTHAVTAEQEGWRFYVVVTGNGGTSVSSSVATLHILAGIAFILQPEDARVIAGGTATFTAQAAGQPDITYQWYVDTGDGRWSAVGSGAASYTTPVLALANSGALYLCRASGTDGRSVDSRPAALTVFLPSPTITGQPQDAYLFPGSTATFTVTAVGDAPLTYRWYVNTGDGWRALSATAASLTTGALAAADDGAQYRCEVTDFNGRSQTSDPAAVHILTPLSITQQPQDASVFPGAAASFTVTAQGEAPFTYQWYADTGSGYQLIATATAATYTTGALAAADNGTRYRCVVGDSRSPSVTSDSAAVRILTPLSITGQPQSASVLPGATASFTVTAQGEAPFTYQWYADTGSGYQLIATATAATYTTGALAAADNGTRYRCVVGDSYTSSVTSNSAAVHLLTPLAITQQPQDATVTQPTASALFTVRAAGEQPITYQWYLTRDGGRTWAAAGGNAPTLTLSGDAIQTGSIAVYCRLEDPYGNAVTSDIAALLRIPQTGDTAHPLRWAVTLLLSAGLLAAAFPGIRKRLGPANGRRRP